MTCPHCPGGEPFTDQEALRKHIKWDHELQHLLYGADPVGIDNLKKKLAGHKGELEKSTDSSEETTTGLTKKSKDTTVTMPTHIQGGN